MAAKLVKFILPNEELDKISEEALTLVPEYMAFKYGILPYKADEHNLYVYGVDDLSKFNGQGWLNRNIIVTSCSAAELRQGLLVNYKLRRLLPAVTAESEMVSKDSRPTDSQPSPLAELVGAVIEYAILKRTSDIHFEPLTDRLQIRLRIDGVLQVAFVFSAAIQPAVVSRLKIMAGLDIAEKRLPQDGRIIYNTSSDGEYELRLATLPSQYGEKVVLRILQRHMKFLDLTELGFATAELERYRSLLHRPHGLIVCCGATGCGKTTTMYASLKELTAEAVNIVTVEDPIERSIDGVVQCGVNQKAGFDFAAGLRAILRQDPDIILVGEIRDEKTAKTAVRAAITGHMVLATLHTHDAVNAIVRLIDMGVSPFLLADALAGSLAQRLVRRICSSCCTTDESGQSYGKGCRKCDYTGYHGRTAVYELLTVDDALRYCIRHNADRTEIYNVARQNGMIPLQEAAVAKAAAGITTRAEVRWINYE